MTTINSGNAGAGKRFVSGALGVSGTASASPPRKGIAWLGEGSQLFLLALLGVGAFVLLMMMLAWWYESTGGGSAGDAVDPATRTITLALSTEPPQLDSTRATDMVSGQILGHVMEGLVRYDEFNRIVPGVAERWEIGASEAVFHLRDDSRWSDGTPVTAHDFVFAWRKAVEPETASEYAFILYAIENARAVNEGELPSTSLGATAVDDLTLAIRLQRPIGYFDKLVAFPTYYPIKQTFYEGRDGRYGADAEDLLYNGPFVIKRWVHGAQLRMSRNDEYWDRERVRLNTIDYGYVTSDVNATLNLYKDGRVAIAGLDAETLQNALEQRWKLERFNDGSVFFIEFNHRPSRLTHNRNLRKAIQFVFDPAELVYKVIKLPGNTPGESLFPVWLKGVDGYFRQEYPRPRTPRRYCPGARVPGPRQAGTRSRPVAAVDHSERRQSGGEQGVGIFPGGVRVDPGNRSKTRPADFQAAPGQDDGGGFRHGAGRMGSGLRRSPHFRRPVRVLEQEQSRSIRQS